MPRSLRIVAMTWASFGIAGALLGFLSPSDIILQLLYHCISYVCPVSTSLFRNLRHFWMSEHHNFRAEKYTMLTNAILQYLQYRCHKFLGYSLILLGRQSSAKWYRTTGICYWTIVNLPTGNKWQVRNTWYRLLSSVLGTVCVRKL